MCVVVLCILVISIPLRRKKNARVTSGPNKDLEKVRAALTRWDEMRQAAVVVGKDRALLLWDVVYCSRSEFVSSWITFLHWRRERS